MAIVEKRQLFRLNDQIKVKYANLNDEDVNQAIEQLSHSDSRMSLFPTIKANEPAIKTNITVYGLSFFANTSLLEDTFITLAFILSASPHPIYAVGQVAYCKYDYQEKRYKVGVRFKYLSKPDMQLLEDYLVTKLQHGMSKHLSDQQVLKEEKWLFDQRGEYKN